MRTGSLSSSSSSTDRAYRFTVSVDAASRFPEGVDEDGCCDSAALAMTGVTGVGAPPVTEPVVGGGGNPK